MMVICLGEDTISMLAFLDSPPVSLSAHCVRIEGERRNAIIARKKSTSKSIQEFPSLQGSAVRVQRTSATA
jgi:hypothetical protein